jgi:hypothetical protein
VLDIHPDHWAIASDYWPRNDLEVKKIEYGNENLKINMNQIRMIRDA